MFSFLNHSKSNYLQQKIPDNRLNNKELPTTKWRRDRRIRMSSEYHSSPSASPIAVKPLSESNSSNSANSPNTLLLAASPVGLESPLDMSVSATNKPPPPPYREPLPGSQFSHHQTHVARPSVITQAPKRDTIGAGNQENNRVAPVGEC